MMVDIAKPWKHPETGSYYLRRQIPVALRPAFEGRTLYKRGLGTKDARQAAALFLHANAELDARFEEARRRLRTTGSPLPSSRDNATTLIQAYFNGPAKSPGGLDGPGRLELARREIDRGLWDGAQLPGGGGTGLGSTPPSTSKEWTTLAGNAALFAMHRGTISHVGGVQPGGIWQRRDLTFGNGGRAAQLARLAEQVALYHGLAADDLPPELTDELEHFLDALPVAPTQSRRPRGTPNRLRPDMRMVELFDDWQAGNQPSAQTAIEFRASVTDFVDYLGDIPVAQITSDDILDYRDQAKELPAAMPKAERLLSFTARIAKHAPDKGDGTPRPSRISPATLQKRVGAIQAMLTYAKKQRWITTNVGRDLAILSSKSSSPKRRTFEEEQLAELFSQPLFLDRGRWSWTHRTSDCSLYWLFLICCTTGARIEEIGQALLTDVKRRSGVTYIDVDKYVEDTEIDPANDDQGGKSVKNDNSCRLIPVHDRLLELGFSDYCDALRVTGQIRVFPDLFPNKLGKRTQDASKRANALIDRVISKDRRLVFHGFRHGFTDRATEAGLSTRVIMQICGHAATTVNGKYGSGVRLPALHGFLHQLAWPEIEWDELVKGANGTDWSAVAARHARRRAA